MEQPGPEKLIAQIQGEAMDLPVALQQQIQQAVEAFQGLLQQVAVHKADKKKEAERISEQEKKDEDMGADAGEHAEELLELKRITAAVAKEMSLNVLFALFVSHMFVDIYGGIITCY